MAYPVLAPLRELTLVNDTSHFRDDRPQLSNAAFATIVGQTVRLHRQGRLFAGCCPFHGEKTPSFFVYPKDSHFHCFGCGAHGDAVDFVMHTRRLSFPEAVAWLSGQNVAAFTPAARPPQPSDNQRNAELARKLWPSCACRKARSLRITYTAAA